MLSLSTYPPAICARAVNARTNIVKTFPTRPLLAISDAQNSPNSKSRFHICLSHQDFATFVKRQRKRAGGRKRTSYNKQKYYIVKTPKNLEFFKGCSKKYCATPPHFPFNFKSTLFHNARKGLPPRVLKLCAIVNLKRRKETMNIKFVAF